ncbi:MAG: TonB-dependent receptor [Brevundimonas sp.]|nr:TonB-dependent receptor [Brevundimonas sp.]
MRKAIWLTGVAASVLGFPAMAQVAPSGVAEAPRPTGPISEAPEVDAAQRGVLVFEPPFFAASRPNTAWDMIARLPGFSFSSGDSGTRGLAGAGGNVLIDGQPPASKTDSLDNVLGRISAASVARIELVRGGAPGIDMRGHPVVANVVLVRTVTTERVLELNAYTYPDGYLGPVLLMGWSRREGDQQIEAEISAASDRTDGTGPGFRRRYDASGALTQDAGLDRWDRYRNMRATGALQRRFAGGRLRINALIGLNEGDERQAVLIRSGAGSDSLNEETEQSLESEFGLNWVRDLGPRSAIELTGLQRYESEDYVGVSDGGGDSETFTADSTAGESILRGALRFRPTDRWAFEAGVEGAWNVLDSATTYAENGVPVPLPSAAVRVEELRGELFGQATWRPSPAFTLEAGLRIEGSEISQSGDSDTAKTFTYAKPRLQATWTPRAGHQLRLRLEQDVGQLDFDDFIASADIDIGEVEAGNPDLAPQQETVLEALYERRFWDDGVFDATIQTARIEDVVDIIPLAGGFDGVGNIGKGKSGFLRLRLTLPFDRLGLANAQMFARTTWSWSQVTDPVTGETRRAQDDQPFSCEVNFNHDLDGGRWSWGFEHGCDTDKGKGYRVREIRTWREEPFVLVYGQWKPRDDLTLRLDLGNAADQKLGQDRLLWSGPRDVAPVSGREVRQTEASPWLYVQVRKTF